MWFNDSIAGTIGVAIGITMGILGTITGLMSMKKGKDGRFILKSFIAIIIMGVGMLLVGIYALADGQPYHIGYSLCLVGFLACAILTPNYFLVRKHYTKTWDRKRIL